MDKISIYFAFDPCPDTKESRKTFEERDKWLFKDYERFEMELRGSPDFPNDQLETLQLRNTALKVLAAPMYVDGRKIASTEFLHAGLEKTALKRLEKLETVLLKLEHEALGNDKNDFQTFKFARMLEKVKGILSDFGKAIERREVEVWEWSNHYTYAGQFHFRTLETFDQSTQFETVFENGEFHCRRVTPPPTETLDSLPEPERKAIAPADLPTFDELFTDPAFLPKTFSAMRKMGIINDADQWIYSDKKKGAIVAVIDVLNKRDALQKLLVSQLAESLAKRIGTTIGARTTRERPQYYEALFLELCSRIS
ncbi:MAG: hypothetical protein IPN76_16725 [Saprospiraceae bacterium]|nr:hypothetical protein [Saprospiraceae bacterium]